MKQIITDLCMKLGINEDTLCPPNARGDLTRTKTNGQYSMTFCRKGMSATVSLVNTQRPYLGLEIYDSHGNIALAVIAKERKQFGDGRSGKRNQQLRLERHLRQLIPRIEHKGLAQKLERALTEGFSPSELDAGIHEMEIPIERPEIRYLANVMYAILTSRTK